MLVHGSEQSTQYLVQVIGNVIQRPDQLLKAVNIAANVLTGATSGSSQGIRPLVQQISSFILEQPIESPGEQDI